MVATKMFLDMWRNLTNATSNWTISSTSSSSTSSRSSSSSSSSVSSRNKWSRYNRLRSPPTKSYSQPANLSGLTASSMESLNEDDVDADHHVVGVPLDDDGDGQHQQEKKMEGPNHLQQLEGVETNKLSHKEKEIINVGRGFVSSISKKSGNGKQTIKHSFTTSSFLPFSSSSFSRRAFGGNGFSSSSSKDPPTKPPPPSTTTKNIAKGISTNNGGKLETTRIPISTRNGRGNGGYGGNDKNNPLPTTNLTANNQLEESRQQKEEFCVVEHVISDLDDDDDDDGYHLACDVCDRAFSTFKDLADHQRKKRHFGCVQCDTLFPNREGLDIHREQMCHYEFAIDLAGYRDYGRDDQDDTDSFITDDDENGFGYSDDGDDEEMERLL